MTQIYKYLLSDSSKNSTFILKNSANYSIFASVFDLRSSNSTLIFQFCNSASTRLRLQSFDISLGDEPRVGTPLRRYLFVSCCSYWVILIFGIIKQYLQVLNMSSFDPRSGLRPLSTVAVHPSAQLSTPTPLSPANNNNNNNNVKNDWTLDRTPVSDWSRSTPSDSNSGGSPGSYRIMPPPPPPQSKKPPLCKFWVYKYQSIHIVTSILGTSQPQVNPVQNY